MASSVSTQRRALVVDDEAALTKLVRSYLEREEFTVDVAHNGFAALALTEQVEPDVVVLDVGLPDLDGLEVCRRLRMFSDAYVVMVTARDSDSDAIAGLSAGADDYLTKPFSPGELAARVHAMLRRPRLAVESGTAAPAGAASRRAFGALVIDTLDRRVSVDGRQVALTRTEFEVLAALSAQPKAVLTRRELLAAVWGESWAGTIDVVDVHVGHVRRKLGDDPAAPRFVLTVRGVGYRMGYGHWPVPSSVGR